MAVADHDQERQPASPGEPPSAGEPAGERPLAGQQPPFGPRASLQGGPLAPAGLGPPGSQDAGLREYRQPRLDQPGPGDFGLPDRSDSPGNYGPASEYDPRSGDYGATGDGQPGEYELQRSDYGPPGPGEPQPGNYGPPAGLDLQPGDYGPPDFYDRPPGEYGPPGDYGPPGEYGPARSLETRPGDYGPPGLSTAAPRGPASWPTAPATAAPAGFLLPGREQPPSSGWRRVLYQGTSGLVRLPASAADLRRQDLISRARTPVHDGHHRVAVISLKGGVGKTSTTICLGAALSALRGDRIIAVDASPDRGTLRDKAGVGSAATVRDLLAERDQIRRYADVRGYTAVTPGGLEVLASDRDPASSEAFSGADFTGLCDVLERFYCICLADCGTGLLHSAMSGVLRLADQLVLVTSPTVDGARSAGAALDWLTAHASRDLVRRAVVVLSGTRPRHRSRIDVSQLEEHFGARCRAVVAVPHDPHLAEGADIDPGLLRRPTADAYLALAALIGDGCGRGSPARRGRAR